MRTKYMWMQILVLAALGIGVIITLLPQLGTRRGNTPPVEISVLLREDISEGWAYIYQGMEQAAADLGGKLRMVAPEHWNSSEEQEALLQWEIDRGADVLIVAPADVQSFARLLKDRPDIPPVVAIESPLEGAACSVLPENYDVGQMLAQELLKDWDSGVVVLLNSGGSNKGIDQRVEGAKAVLEAAELPVRVVNIPAPELEKQLPFALKTDCDWVLALERTATERATEVVKKEQLSIPVYGVGITPKIAAGLEKDAIIAVVAISDYAAGYLAVENAIDIAQGKTAVSVTPPNFLVHKEDIHDTEVQKLLFPVDE